ncbi:helix-turn-helix domain-containing protein [Erythrobacter sp. EC-HK427]|uniref:helix-turn-helix domain-containing protein n=1 Tax=Erythrobacter sp. EC-HK427 TaxID=2038396 RepID=UPI001253BB8F|nr:AraC family transcriptional regulator [Erythrobacter sp. EC-HK427]VVT01004.1 putative HTH-type transcriptional regulator VirS [Erythrobacter sp. EC-HK427]
MTHDTAPGAPQIRMPASYVRAIIRRYESVLSQDADWFAAVQDALARPANSGSVALGFLFDVVDRLNRRIGPAWPIDAAPVWRTAMHGSLDVATRSSATIGDAIDILVRYGRVRAPFFTIRQIMRPQSRTLIFMPVCDMEKPVFQALGEAVVLSGMGMLDQVSEGQIDGIGILVPWQAPDHAGILNDRLGGVISFGAPQIELRIPASLCPMPIPFFDPDLLAAARHELDHALGALSGVDLIVEDVKRLLAASGTARTSEEAIARQLGLSRRTLVRRLGAHGTTFRRLLDGHLIQKAAQLSATRALTRDALADQLGYADPTSLSRAMRRWRKDEAGG